MTDTPQQHRKRMINLMIRMCMDHPFIEWSIDMLFKNFQLETGASKTKTQEYFDLAVYKLSLQIVNNGKHFLYRAENEEENLKKTVEVYKDHLADFQKRLDEIEKNKQQNQQASKVGD